MERDLKAMLDLSRNLIARYTDVVQAGAGGWRVAAYCRLGDTYARFAAALEEAAVPREIDPRRWRKKKPDDPARISAEEAYIAYVKALNDQIMPLEGNAAANYRDAVNAAAEAGISGEWLEQAKEALERLEAAGYIEEKKEK
jgi:hypothetical protein